MVGGHRRSSFNFLTCLLSERLMGEALFRLTFFCSLSQHIRRADLLVNSLDSKTVILVLTSTIMADIPDGRPQSIIGGDDGRSQTTTTQTQQQACSDVCNNDCVTRSPAAVELGIIFKESGCGTSTCSIDDCSTSKCNTRDCSANKCTLAAQCSTSKCSASQSQRHKYSSNVAAAPASAPCIKNGQCCSTTQSGVGKFNEGGTFIDCKPMGRLAARGDDSSCDEKSPCCTSSKIRNTVDSGKTSPGRFHTDEKAAHANDDGQLSCYCPHLSLNSSYLRLLSFSGSLCDCCLRYVLEDVLGMPPIICSGGQKVLISSLQTLRSKRTSALYPVGAYHSVF